LMNKHHSKCVFFSYAWIFIFIFLWYFDMMWSSISNLYIKLLSILRFFFIFWK
jgi:hypothetical protein